MNFSNNNSIPSSIINPLKAQILLVQQSIVDHQTYRINQKYCFPASFNKALVHKNAVKFGYNAPTIKKQNDKNFDSSMPNEVLKHSSLNMKVCPCCCQQINTKSIDITYHTTDPQKQQTPYLLNSSSSMFFSFLKMSILYLILVFVICGAFNMVTSFSGKYCQRYKICQKSMFELISTYNKHGDAGQSLMQKIQNILCLVFVVLSIIFFILYRKIQYHLYDQIDAEHQTQNDYSIFVENIPILDFKKYTNSNYLNCIEFDYQLKLKELFQSEINEWIQNMINDPASQQGIIQKDLIQVLTNKNKKLQDLNQEKKITTVSMCFVLQQLQRINYQRQLLMQQHLKKIKFAKDQIIQHEEFSHEMAALNKIELNLCQKFAEDNSPIFNITHFVGKAFISFQYQHYREYILQKYQDKSKQFVYGKNKLVLDKAAHPNDINWFNMKISDSQRIKKILISYSIIGMILVFSAAALVLIDIVKLKGIKDEKQANAETIIFNYTLNIVSSAFAFFINTFIYFVILELTEFEMHSTMTTKFTSQIIKTLIAQFLNAALIFYLIQIFNHRPYLSSAGLVVQASFMMVVSGFVSIFFNCLNIPYWIRYFKIWHRYGSAKNRQMSFSPVSIYQMTLNRDFELPVFHLADRYSYYLLAIYSCMFYCYLVPVGVIATVIIIAINYWIDKIKMFKLSSQYQELGYFLSRTILKVFQGSLLIFTIGNLIFSSTISGNYVDAINIISLGIASVYVCFITFAPTVLERKVFAKYQTLQKNTYSDCIQNFKFNQTYWTQNPATMFAKQTDINDSSKFISNSILHKFVNENDFDDENDQINNHWLQI